MEQFSEEYIALLATKYKEGNLSETERKDFLSWYGQIAEELDEPESGENEAVKVRMLQHINAHVTGQDIREQHVKKTPYRWMAAAAILVIFSAGWLFLNQSNKSKTDQVAVLKNIEASPGINRAYLTLSNGQKIDLSNVNAGVIANLNGVSASKSKGNMLVYEASPNQVSNAVNKMSVLSTPAGGQYEVVLPDGTHVWLNAASTLSFPEQFSSTERRITLKGEAYFEVAHDASRPFRVSTSRQNIEVLGTHFNISAYDDEPRTLTTLLQGSVRVSSAAKNTIIKPGEQAVSSERNDIQVQQANIRIAMAWKNGMIAFEDANLRQIMRQVARWYNIKVEFSGSENQEVFTGGVSRDSKLSALLEILKANNIRFSMREEGGLKILTVNQ
ncbi:fec operon regulator FecR [compost metagenome]